MLYSIRSRLLGLVFAAAVPFIALIGVGLWSQWQDDEADARLRALAEARLFAAQVDDYIGNLENLLAGLSHAVSTNPADIGKNDLLLRTVKAEVPDLISTIFVFDLNGSNIGSSQPMPSRISAGDRAYFRLTLLGQRFSIGDVFRGRATGDWVMTAARPVEDQWGQLTGVLAIGTPLAHFQDVLRMHALPAGSVVRIVSEKGIVLASTVDPERWIGRNVSDIGDVARQIAAKEGAELARWPDDVERITGSSTAHRVPWLISVGIPTEVASAAVATRFAWGALYGTLSLLAAFVIGWALSGRIANPLRQLSQDATKLATGKLGHRTQIREKGELGVLADAFNAMATSLDRRQEEAARNAEEMREAKETLTAVIEASPAAIVCTTLDRRIVLWNRAAEHIFGYTAEEAVDEFSKIIPPDRLAESQNLFERAISGETIRGVEVKRLRKDGSLVDVRLATTATYYPDGRLRAMVWAYDDISDYKGVEQQLRRVALFDSLTGLPNRLCLEREMGRALARAGGEAVLAMALFDLDGFKHVNDTLGHSAGDELLVEVGQRLTEVAEAVGQQCRAYRLGGDEFVLLIDDCGDPIVAAAIVADTLDRLAAPFEIGGQIMHVGGSAGLAFAPDRNICADELIVNADLALYQAKSDGGRVYRIFTPTMRAAAAAKRALDLELRRAFGDHELELYFQPQVRLSDRAVVGAEALLRWNHPVNGLIGPGAFLNTLEESSIAPDVGKWIIQTACRQLMAWRAKGLSISRISVNLFPGRQLVARQFRDVEDALALTGLPPDSLELEVTENFALDCDDAVSGLQRLHGKGIKLAFDDFGTGYASLSNLMRFPVSRIKIDRSFVSDIDQDVEKAAIVRALIAMARNLNLSVTAEGIETAEQERFLIDESCEEGQGFLFCKPLPAIQFEILLSTGRLDGNTGVEQSRRVV